MKKPVVTSENYQYLNKDVKRSMDGIMSHILTKKAFSTNPDNIRFSFDPTTIVMIANVVINITRLLYTCYCSNSQKVLDGMKDPGFFERMLIKRQIRKSLRKGVNISVEEVYDAVTKYSKDMSQHQVSSLVKVYKNGEVLER